MQIEFDEKELAYLERMATKSLKASRKNFGQTKSEEQKEAIRTSIGIKDKIVKKIRDAQKGAVTE